MATYDGLQFYGLDIETDLTKFHGIVINANNFFNEKIRIVDQSGDAISGATVTITSTQTNPSNYIGDITATSDSEGFIEATGSSTTGTTITVEADDYSTYNGSLPSSGLNGNGSSLSISLTPASSGGSSKKIYTTNKGNILINPNDTILIEL